MGRPVFFAGVFSVDAGVFRLWILPLAGRLFFSCRGRVGRFGCREFFPGLRVRYSFFQCFFLPFLVWCVGIKFWGNVLNNLKPFEIFCRSVGCGFFVLQKEIRIPVAMMSVCHIGTGIVTAGCAVIFLCGFVCQKVPVFFQPTAQFIQGFALQVPHGLRGAVHFPGCFGHSSLPEIYATDHRLLPKSEAL